MKPFKFNALLICMTAVLSTSMAMADDSSDDSSSYNSFLQALDSVFVTPTDDMSTSLPYNTANLLRRLHWMATSPQPTPPSARPPTRAAAAIHPMGFLPWSTVLTPHC